MSNPEGDLRGITVLDLAGIGPAPRCLRVLADLGARWVRLLPPRGAGRLLPRWYHYGALRGVEQFEIDLKHPAAVALFLRLAAKADVVVESFRPGVVDRLGIGYETVRAVNERIIYCSITGYGQQGEYARSAGHDLNYQSLAGALAAAQGLPGLTLADSAGGGWHAAIRILAALVSRRGARLDVSASEGVLQLMSVAIDEHLAGEGGRMLVHGRYACYDLYRTSDGGRVAVAAIESRFFANLCRALGLERLAPKQYDDAAQSEIRDAFTSGFASKSRDEWTALLQPLDACVTPVLSLDEVAGHPQWQLDEYDHPVHGRQRQVKPFGGGSRGDAVAPEETFPDRVLATFGVEAAEIGRLKADGVIR